MDVEYRETPTAMSRSLERVVRLVARESDESARTAKRGLAPRDEGRQSGLLSGTMLGVKLELHGTQVGGVVEFARMTDEIKNACHVGAAVGKLV